MFLPTRLLGPTCLLIFEKSPTYMVIRAPRLLGTSEYVAYQILSNLELYTYKSCIFWTLMLLDKWDR